MIVMTPAGMLKQHRQNHRSFQRHQPPVRFGSEKREIDEAIIAIDGHSTKS